MILTPEEAFFLTHQGDFHTKRKVSVSQVANTKKETVFKWLKDDALYETETSPDLERGTCELLIPKVRHAMPRHATPRHATPAHSPLGRPVLCDVCQNRSVGGRLPFQCTVIEGVQVEMFHSFNGFLETSGNVTSGQGESK